MKKNKGVDHITTSAAVNSFSASSPIFEGVIQEVRELSKKKPEATMSSSKVKIINRILNDLLVFLKDEPEGKYLEILDDESLPQMSDAVLAMVQFESALNSFRGRYLRHINFESYWITHENKKDWMAALDAEKYD
jgi:hypothetical protein